ncbi:hypothetical protein BpHYR1_021312 [Brachionus plicatilis]|uniref:Uncharacterized protein n=1 Tax=Brachionus plicatilis TaxID=10195 RepID=A0A3M7P5I3_BRAPC|nr:hypothetical protein BpHYR1_021312 [Brachionus plicatilis]
MKRVLICDRYKNLYSTTWTSYQKHQKMNNFFLVDLSSVNDEKITNEIVNKFDKLQTFDWVFFDKNTQQNVQTNTCAKRDQRTKVVLYKKRPVQQQQQGWQKINLYDQVIDEMIKRYDQDIEGFELIMFKLRLLYLSVTTNVGVENVSDDEEDQEYFVYDDFDGFNPLQMLLSYYQQKGCTFEKACKRFFDEKPPPCDYFKMIELSNVFDLRMFMEDLYLELGKIKE